ncbi:MAG: CDP-alcohol phosphatidyltransferase family protein [Candidatus Cryptobacteroides sp.]
MTGAVAASLRLKTLNDSPYLLCGLSDVIDGAIARRTGTASRLGERLDTIADIVFVAVWMILFLPAVNAGKWIWIWVGMIATVKFVNIVSGFIVLKAFVTKHTLANKVTGILLFLLPMTIQVESIKSPMHNPGMQPGDFRRNSGGSSYKENKSRINYVRTPPLYALQSLPSPRPSPQLSRQAYSRDSRQRR